MGKRAYEPMKPDSDDDADKSEQPWQRRARGDEVGPSGQAHTATSSASAPSSASGTTYPSSVLNQAFYYGRSNSILDNPTAPPAKQLGASVPPFTLKDLTPRATKEQLASRKILKALRPGIQSTAEKVGPKPKNPWQFVDLTLGNQSAVHDKISGVSKTPAQESYIAMSTAQEGVPFSVATTEEAGKAPAKGQGASGSARSGKATAASRVPKIPTQAILAATGGSVPAPFPTLPPMAPFAKSAVGTSQPASQTFRFHPPVDFDNSSSVAMSTNAATPTSGSTSASTPSNVGFGASQPSQSFWQPPAPAMNANNGHETANTEPHDGPPFVPNTKISLGMAHGHGATSFGGNYRNGAAAAAATTNGASSARKGVNKEFDSTYRPIASAAKSTSAANKANNGVGSANNILPAGLPMATTANIDYGLSTLQPGHRHPNGTDANISQAAASTKAAFPGYDNTTFGPTTMNGAPSASVANAPSADKSKDAIGANPSSQSYTPPHATAGFGSAINNESPSASFASNTTPAFQTSSFADANASKRLNWAAKTPNASAPPISATTASSSIRLGHRSAFNTTGMTSPSRPSADVNHACTVKSTMHASTRHTRPGTGFKASLKTITECCESEKTQIESLSTSPPAETSVTQAGKSRSVDTATCSGTQMIVENGKESMEGSNALNDPTATLEVATSSKTGATPIARTDRLSDGPVMMPPQASSSAASSDPNKSSNTAPTAENTSVERIDGYTVEDASPESATTAAVLAVSAPSADPAAGSVGLPASDNSLVALLARHALALAGQAKNGIAPHGSLGHDPVPQNVIYQNNCKHTDNSTHTHTHHVSHNYSNASANDDMSERLDKLTDLAEENRDVVENMSGKVDNIQQSVQKAPPSSAWKGARTRQNGSPSVPTVLFGSPLASSGTTALSSGAASSRSRRADSGRVHSAFSPGVPSIQSRRKFAGSSAKVPTPSNIGGKTFNEGDRVWFENKSKTAKVWGTVLEGGKVKGCYQVRPDDGTKDVPKKPLSLHLGTDE